MTKLKSEKKNKEILKKKDQMVKIVNENLKA